jgi:hypothetical protein
MCRTGDKDVSTGVPARKMHLLYWCLLLLLLLLLLLQSLQVLCSVADQRAAVAEIRRVLRFVELLPDRSNFVRWLHGVAGAGALSIALSYQYYNSIIHSARPSNQAANMYPDYLTAR